MITVALQLGQPKSRSHGRVLAWTSGAAISRAVRRLSAAALSAAPFASRWELVTGSAGSRRCP
jgi:hypothetical protein